MKFVPGKLYRIIAIRNVANSGMVSFIDLASDEVATYFPDKIFMAIRTDSTSGGSYNVYLAPDGRLVTCGADSITQSRLAEAGEG